jgi:hypothetical protein
MKKLIKMLDNWEEYLDRYIFIVIIGNVVLGLFFFRLWAWLVGFIVAVGVIIAPFVQVLKEEKNTIKKSLTKLPVILWCAVMFASVGTIGLPFVVKYTAPVICPVGYQEIAPYVHTKVHDMPGRVQSATMRPICIGEDGYYVPDQLLFLATIFSAFLIFAVVLNLIAISVDSVIEGRGYSKKSRYIWIPLLFILFLFLIRIDNVITPSLTKFLNNLIYADQSPHLIRPLMQ